MHAQVINTQQRGCEEARVWSWLVWQVSTGEYVHTLLDREPRAGRIATICCQLQICVRLYNTDLNVLGDGCDVHMYRLWK